MYFTRTKHLSGHMQVTVFWEHKGRITSDEVIMESTTLSTTAISQQPSAVHSLSVRGG